MKSITSLVNEAAVNLGMSKSSSNALVEEVFSIMAEAIGDGEDVKLYGFGKFLIQVVPEKQYAAAIGSKERKLVPAHAKLVFRPSKYLSNKIAKIDVE